MELNTLFFCFKTKCISYLNIVFRYGYTHFIVLKKVLQFRVILRLKLNVWIYSVLIK